MKTKKIKKGLHRKILGYLITFTWSVLLFHRKKRLWWPVFGQKFASCATTKVYSSLGSTSSNLGGHGSKCHLPCIGVARIFDWGGGGQTKNHIQWSRQKFSKEELFVRQRCRRMEDQKPRPGLALNREFCKGRGLKAKITNKQARSQDLEKGGGYFERVRKVQTTLTRIFIVLESVSLGLSENLDEISRNARKLEGFFRSKLGGLQKKKKKGLRRNWVWFFGRNPEFKRLRGAVFLWGGLFSIFHKKSASKAPKTCDFAYFTSQWGGSSPPAPPWLRYCKWIYLNWETCVSKLVFSNVSQTGIWRRSPCRWAIFRKFFEKKAILMLLDHISHVFRTIWKN